MTRRTTPAELLARLQQWAPKQRWFDLASSTERGVNVSIALERDSTGLVWLAARFAPTLADTHLYASALPDNGIDGIGRPTRLAIVASPELTPLGEAIADRPVEFDRIDAIGAALAIYPAGPVTLRVPVSLPRGVPSMNALVDVSYMACGPKGCLPPVAWRRGVGSRPMAWRRCGLTCHNGDDDRAACRPPTSSTSSARRRQLSTGCARDRSSVEAHNTSRGARHTSGRQPATIYCEACDS